MGETIDQTRLEIAAQRAELEATADRLRDALDLRKRIREHPAAVIGIGAVTAFLVVGGPRRLARRLRGTMAPHAAEEAYDALPETMQAWVSALAGEAGSRSQNVRDELVEELRRWRRDPIKDKKARKELARHMVDGPPGPRRTAWNAAETALTLIAAALARKAVARFLTNEAPRELPAAVAASEAAPARKATRRRGGDTSPEEATATAPVAPAEPSDPERTEYSGWSSR
ncbi:MAG: hypothetical protein ACXWWU_10035 [Candidatus Limnocylindria bacterium]